MTNGVLIILGKNYSTIIVDKIILAKHRKNERLK